MPLTILNAVDVSATLMLSSFYDLTQGQKREIVKSAVIALKERLNMALNSYELLDLVRDLSIDGFAELGRGYIFFQCKENIDFEGDAQLDELPVIKTYSWVPLSDLENQCILNPELKEDVNLITDVIELAKLTNKIAIFAAHSFEKTDIVSIEDCENTRITNFPFLFEWKLVDLSAARDELLNTAFLEDCLQKEVAIANQPAPRKQPEKQKELDLYSWMRRNKIEVERQVSTNQKHRIDLWIPGKLMIELKQGKVTGDDVCQAIDYYSVYRKPIVLVGASLSAAASRGIEAFVRLHGEDSLQFVTHGAIKPYLRGLVSK